MIINLSGKMPALTWLAARLAGMKPIAVTNHANTYEQSIDGAIDKLKTSLEKITGRLKNH